MFGFQDIMIVAWSIKILYNHSSKSKICDSITDGRRTDDDRKEMLI